MESIDLVNVYNLLFHQFFIFNGRKVDYIGFCYAYTFLRTLNIDTTIRYAGGRLTFTTLR